MIRPAEPSDAGPLSAIARGAYAPYVAAIGREPPPMNPDFPALIAAGRVLAWDRPPLAFLIGWAEGEAWHVSNLAVSPAAQGRGIGRALMAAAEAQARAAGLRRIALYTNAAMAGPLALYPRLGFRRTGERVEDGLHRVWFVRDLG